MKCAHNFKALGAFNSILWEKLYCISVFGREYIHEITEEVFRLFDNVLRSGIQLEIVLKVVALCRGDLLQIAGEEGDPLQENNMISA